MCMIKNCPRVLQITMLALLYSKTLSDSIVNFTTREGRVFTRRDLHRLVNQLDQIPDLEPALVPRGLDRVLVHGHVFGTSHR